MEQCKGLHCSCCQRPADHTFKYRGAVYGTVFSAVLQGHGTQTGDGGCRLEGGELQFAEHAHNEDMGGIESLVDLDAGFADDEEYDEVSSHVLVMLCVTSQSCLCSNKLSQNPWICRMMRIQQMVTDWLQRVAW